jgi:HK97 family phage portal protein
MSAYHDIMKTAKDLVGKVIAKSIPTVIRQTDQEFLLGNRIARIFGANEPSEREEIVYTTTPWVHAAINAIARNIQIVPFVFQTKGGKASESHAFVDLFERPNRWQGFGQFMESLVSWLHLEGEVFIVLRRDNDTQVPKEMVIDNPSKWEEVLSDETHRLVGWLRVLENGEKVPFRFHEVIHIRFWNPLDDIRGLTPLAAANNAIIQDQLTNAFNTNFFRNSGSPNGVIEMEENLTDKQFERLARQYDDRHGGPQNAHKMLLLEGGAKFKTTNFSQKDMEFLNQKKWNRDEILAVFGVPKMEVGIIEEGANLAVIKMQSQEFWQKNLIPKMNLIEWALWSQLFAKINGGRVWAEFDTSGIPALYANFQENVQTARTLWEMGWTGNQINKRLNLGLEENSWQNFGYRPVNIEPLAVDEKGTPIPPDVSNPAADPFVPSATGTDNSKVEGTPVTPTEPAMVRPFVAQAGRATVADVQKFFYKQRVRQLQRFEDDNTNLFDVDDEVSKLMEATNNSIDSRVCDQIVTSVHQHLLRSVTLHLGDKEAIINETKKLYNKLGKAVPDIVIKIHEGSFVQSMGQPVTPTV